ncbi:Protein cwh43 [Yarrowia sp. C11]|nr:Protein cwh43 [Yarrowia sp. C11]
MGSYKEKPQFVLQAPWIPIISTLGTASAYFLALVVGSFLHFRHHSEEAFPGLSSVIGGQYPERSIFQVLMAIFLAPRIISTLLWSQLGASSENTILSNIGLFGSLKIVSSILFTYVSIADDPAVHHYALVFYVASTVACMYAQTVYSVWKRSPATNPRAITFGLYMLLLILVTNYSIKHMLYEESGASTKLSLVEWLLVGLDVSFDYYSTVDFEGIRLEIANQKRMVHFMV